MPKNENETGKESIWFLDMDGTLAEWRVGMEGELKKPGYFRSLRPTEFVKPIREFVAKHRGRAFILSSYMDGCQALAEKQEWVDEYIPEIDRAHRLFVPCGESKAEYVKEYFGIPALTEAMVLFDDFSKNLHLWNAAGGRGIKCFNGINGNHGTWTGDGVMWSKEIREKLETCK